MTGASRGGIPEVDPCGDRRSCAMRHRRAGAYDTDAAWQRVDPAGPVENSESEFPTGPWTRRERATTGSTRVLTIFRD